jgi:hypothetical protein
MLGQPADLTAPPHHAALLAGDHDASIAVASKIGERQEAPTSTSAQRF